jgi:hypothetical protein
MNLMLLLTASGEGDDIRTAHVWVNADRAEIENWFMMRVAFACASSIAKHPACTSSLDDLSFWDSQVVIADHSVPEDDEDSGWLETEKDYSEASRVRTSAMRIHVDEDGVRWTWWGKHSDVRYSSAKLTWERIEDGPDA